MKDVNFVPDLFGIQMFVNNTNCIVKSLQETTIKFLITSQKNKFINSDCKWSEILMAFGNWTSSTPQRMKSGRFGHFHSKFWTSSVSRNSCLDFWLSGIQIPMYLCKINCQKIHCADVWLRKKLFGKPKHKLSCHIK